MSRSLSEFRPILHKEKGLVAMVLLLALIYVGTMLLIPIYMGKAIDVALGGVIPEGDLSSYRDRFDVYIYLMIGLTVVSGIGEYAFEWFANLVSQRAVKDIRDEVFEKLTYLPIKYIDNRSHGDMLSLATVDTENVMTGITAIFKELLEGILTVIFTIAFMFQVNWLLGAIVLFLTPLSFFIAKAVSNRSHRFFANQAHTQGELAGFTLERVKNYRAVRAFRMGGESLAKFEAINQHLYKDGQRAQFSSSWTNPSTRLVNNIVYFTVGLSGVVMIVFSDRLSDIGASLAVGDLTTFLVYALKFAKPFNQISSVATEIQNAMASLRRIETLLALTDEREEDAKLTTPVPLDLKTIEFKDVEFGYEPSQKVLKGLSLSVFAGHRVAIVGPTGCGKTTLINLLLRFYDPRSGKILLGGIDSSRMPRRKVRGLFGMVLQDTWIFNGTVRENISYGKEGASLEEVREAAHKAGADGFIERLPQSYDTPIGPAAGLSEGEKQLLSIARVLLMNPNMIILDEATSSLDPVSEKKITLAIATLSNNRTTIVIAHRLQTIVSSDAIAVVMDGKIGELGTHEQLMAKKGFYYRLYTSQYH